MNLRENIAIILAGVVLALAIVQMVQPVGTRAHPMLLFAAALLLALRWVLRRQALHRKSLVDQVPRRPLGIGDDKTEE